MPDASPSPPNPVKRPEKESGLSGISKKFWEEGLAAFYRNDEEGALELFLDVLEVNPGNLRCCYLAALCAAILGDEETLEEVCQKARRTNSRHPYVIGCEAVRAFFYANYERSEHLFNIALRSLPLDLDLHLGLGTLYEEMGAEEKSAEVYRQAVELAPDNIRARISLGMSFALNGEYTNALIEYKQAKAFDPSVENPHQHLGRDYYVDGLFDEAVSEFLQAIAEEPNSSAAYFYLLDCYRRMGRVDEMLDIYQTIKTRFAQDEETASRFFEFFRMYNEALPLLERLVKRNPNDLELLMRLSVVYQETGKFDKAIATLERAVALAPEFAGLWTTLAGLYLQKGDYPQAVASAERAIRLNRYEEEAYGILADALLYLGKMEDAERMAREQERIRDEAWRKYQNKFSGRDKDDNI
ncbi:MAG: tetratricopeptide repeat protein [candidate division WOR-3 bacterium]